MSDDITEEVMSENIYAPEIPDVDLVIRTSGEQRTSGFMLWRAHYAELLFIEKLWPDVTTADMDSAIADYSARQRRFGC